MSNPEAAAAIPALVEAGLLPAEEAPRLLRVARGELVSVHQELRALLYAGVLLLTAGVGLLVKENLDRIGPLAIALALALAAAAALGWALRVAPPFSWQATPSPNLAFDYILLLGLLLAAADLGYCEARFGLLGDHAPLHLLIVAALAGAAAVRCDSRVAFSLALSSFAAWRGVSLARAGTAVLTSAGEIRWNAIACGALFLVLGACLVQFRRKPHFEPVAVHLGCLLVLGALASGIFEGGGAGPAWAVALLLAGGALAAAGWKARRFPLFAYGFLATYAAVTRLLGGLGVLAQALGCLWFAGSSVAVVALLLVAHRQLKRAA